MLRNTGLQTLVAVGIALLFATPATAKTVYKWVTDDGTYAYSDTLKRVPKRYQSEVKTASLGKLQSYKRWTPSDRKAKGDHDDRLAGNLERLRALNAPVHPPMHARRHARSSGVDKIEVRSGRNGSESFHLAIDRDADEPLIIESVRTRRRDLGHTTRHITYVRRGDEVLAIIKPQLNDTRARTPYEEEAQTQPFIETER